MQKNQQMPSFGLIEENMELSHSISCKAFNSTSISLWPHFEKPKEKELTKGIHARVRETLSHL